MAKFLVVKSPSSYNVILGQHTLNSLKAITSTYHLKIKSPISVRVGEIKGKQVLAWVCYAQELKTGKNEVKTLKELTKAATPPPPPQLVDQDEEIRDK